MRVICNVTELGRQVGSRVILKAAWPPGHHTGPPLLAAPSKALWQLPQGNLARKRNLKVTSMTLEKPPSGGDLSEVSLRVAQQTDTLLLEPHSVEIPVAQCLHPSDL